MYGNNLLILFNWIIGIKFRKSPNGIWSMSLMLQWTTKILDHISYLDMISTLDFLDFISRTHVLLFAFLIDTGM